MTGKKFLKTLPPLGVVAPPGVCRQLGDGDVGGNLAHTPSQLLQRRLRSNLWRTLGSCAPVSRDHPRHLGSFGVSLFRKSGLGICGN